MKGGMTKDKCTISVYHVLVAAFVIRAFIPLYAAFFSDDPSVYYEIYSYQYLEPARNLVRSGEFASNGAPEIYRPPGYSILLIPGILLNHVSLVTIAIQIFLSCLTVYLIFRASLILFDRTDVATACAAVYAVEPLSVIFSSLVMPETLLTLMLTVFLFCLLRYLKQGSLRHLFYGALTAAAAVYVQATAYFLPVCVTLVLMAWALRQRKGTVIIHALVFLAISMSLIGLWQIRNRVETGYSGFSTLFDKSLYYAQAASVLAVTEGKSDFREMWGQMERRANEYSEQHAGLSKRFDYMRQEGIRIVLAHPLTYAQIHLQGMIRTLSGAEVHTYVRMLRLYSGPGTAWQELISGRGLLDLTRHDYRKPNLATILVTIVLLLIVVITYLFSVTALFSGKFAKSMPMFSLLSVVSYWLIITGGPHGYSRYRHAMMPVICILAGYGLYIVLSRFSIRHGPHQDRWNRDQIETSV